MSDLKRCNVASVMCNKIYTQAELDKRIKAACEKQREACADIYFQSTTSCDNWEINTCKEAILSAPLAGEE